MIEVWCSCPSTKAATCCSASSGEFLAVAGGTILQLGVPLMLAMFFIFQRQIPGTAFCMFFFFEQFLPISAYMADARAQDLPLITVGDSDYVIHDWNYLFGRLGVLDHDTQIAHTVRCLGWIGMIATMAWFIWRSVKTKPTATQINTDESRKRRTKKIEAQGQTRHNFQDPLS